MRAVFQNLTPGCSFPSTRTWTEFCRFWGLSPGPVTGDIESEVVILKARCIHENTTREAVTREDSSPCGYSQVKTLNCTVQKPTRATQLTPRF